MVGPVQCVGPRPGYQRAGTTSLLFKGASSVPLRVALLGIADRWVAGAGTALRAARLLQITFTDHVVVPQWEPLTALAAIAAVTDRIGLGTLVLDVALGNPVVTAKTAATVERISGGRLELGMGAGGVEVNFAAAGDPFDRGIGRVARLEEAVTLMRRLWTEPSSTMHGRFSRVTDSPMVSPEAIDPRPLLGGRSHDDAPGGTRRRHGLDDLAADHGSVVRSRFGARFHHDGNCRRRRPGSGPARRRWGETPAPSSSTP